MTQGFYETWLQLLINAWRKQDTQAVLQLFANDVIYYESPVEEPVYGVAAIATYWKEIKNQSDIDVSFETLVFSQEGCCANVTVAFCDAADREKYSFDGIYFFKLNQEGLCTFFKQWEVINPTS